MSATLAMVVAADVSLSAEVDGQRDEPGGKRFVWPSALPLPVD